MNNKKKIMSALKQLQMNKENIDKFSKGVKAEEVSKILNIQRSVVSRHLNELVREGEVTKTATRPVYFRYIELERNKPKVDYIESNDPFTKVVGNNNSLLQVVDKCKSAVIYPSRSMSILLLGESGVGKSYMAEIIYEYAKHKKCISKDAQFVVLNCADYANNPELLSSCLFGYKKGAFTGADKDKEGLIEAAQNGYLFLDEVHRLPPEGQEKLFIYLDKGIFKRIGSSEETSNVNVKFIFATTEKPNEVLLDTFLRRIPVKIKIPSFTDRPIEERLALIYQFFYMEYKNTNVEFKVSNRVVNTLLFSKQRGNIGGIRDTIRFSCANSYRRNINEKVKEVLMEDLTDNYLMLSDKIQSYFNKDYLYINDDIENRIDFSIMTCKTGDYFNETIDNVYEEIKKFERSHTSNDSLIKKLTKEINKLIDNITYDSSSKGNELMESIYIQNVSRGLQILNDKYGVKYYGNSSKVLTKFLLQLRDEDYFDNSQENNNIKYIDTYLKKNWGKLYITSDKFISIINSSLDCNIKLKCRVLINLYFISIRANKINSINAILVAHGFSTASSIASLTNKVYEEFIFESFDMPIDMKPKEIIKKVTDYLKNLDTTNGVIILVDMGSLFNMGEEIEKVSKGNIGIINNITTQVALDVGGRIINNQSIERIINSIEKENVIQSKFIEKVKKKKAIITTCITGIGTATKIRDLMKMCLDGNDVEVIEYEYRKLLTNGKNEEIFKYYDIQLIISTIEIELDDVKCILLQDLIKEDGEKELVETLSGMGITKKLNNITSNIVKYFSMENIINQLTILNVNKIINDVEEMIQILERELGFKFSSQLTIIIYIHVSLLVERLITGQDIQSDDDYSDFIINNGEFINAINKSFMNIQKQYGVKINITEINMIYQIISNTISMSE